MTNARFIVAVTVAAGLVVSSCGERAAPALTPTGRQPSESVYAPVQPASYRFIGRWAANTDLCQTGAWTFRSDGLATAGEVSCDFDRVGQRPGGYDIEATCMAQAPPEKSVIHLTFAESTGTMRVEGGPFAGPVTLTHCAAPGGR